MNKNAIVFVMLGREYVKIGKACLLLSLPNIPLSVDVVVLTNQMDVVWPKDPNLVIRYMPVANEVNRHIKINAHWFLGKYDKALYIDCDSVIQKPGIQRAFDVLDDADVVLNPLLLWKKGDQVLKIYKKAMIMFGCFPPISVWNGGIIGFWPRKKVVSDFFSLWCSYWQRFGAGREMPPLACAVANSPELSVVPLPPGFFRPDSLSDIDGDCVVQHHCGEKFHIKFQLPSFQEWKPFDTDPTDFTTVDWEG